MGAHGNESFLDMPSFFCSESLLPILQLHAHSPWGFETTGNTLKVGFSRGGQTSPSSSAPRDALAVETGDLVDELHIPEQDGTAFPGG